MQGLIDFATDGRVGSAASVLGLFATVLGFLITIWNVRRSRTAAEQARAAATTVQRELSRLDAIADVSAAITTMEEIKRLQRQLAWSILPDRYSSLRKHLITIKAAFIGLSDHQRSVLQNAIQHFASIEDHIEKSGGAQTIPWEQVRAELYARIGKKP